LENTINILKIDTQGNEFGVLKDIAEVQEGLVDFIIIELITIEKYQGIEPYSNVLKLIVDAGFVLLKLEPYIENFPRNLLQITEINLLFTQ
jgi:hypothetical protein